MLDILIEKVKTNISYQDINSNTNKYSFMIILRYISCFYFSVTRLMNKCTEKIIHVEVKNFSK